MTPAEIVTWSEAQDAAGKRDAMGRPYTSWLVARYQPDGRTMRDQMGAQVFETQDEFKARQTNQPTAVPVGHTLDLFAEHHP